MFADRWVVGRNQTKAITGGFWFNESALEALVLFYSHKYFLAEIKTLGLKSGNAQTSKDSLLALSTGCPHFLFLLKFFAEVSV